MTYISKLSQRTMQTVALLPLRSLHDGKQRLRNRLSPAERTRLVQTLFVRAVRALRGADCVDQVVVVSPDPALLAWAQQWNVLTVLQPDHGLNEGLEHARELVFARVKASALLTVLPDLPFLQSSDIVELVRLAADRTIVLAPDRHQRGTNALLVQPPHVLPFAFGEASLQRHVAAASQADIAVRYYLGSGTSFDLDTPDDLALTNLPRESLCTP